MSLRELDTLTYAFEDEIFGMTHFYKKHGRLTALELVTLEDHVSV